MNWIFLSLIAPAITALVIFVDKYVVENKVKDSLGMPVFSAITAFLFGSFLWFILGMPILNPRNAFIVLLSGFISMQAYALYYYALARNHASYMIALMQTTPVFALILSMVFLNETVDLFLAAGFVLVLISVIGLTINHSGKQFKLNRGVAAIMLANLLFAVGVVIIKFAAGLNAFVPILIYESWGLGFGGLALYLAFKRVRTAFHANFRSVGAKVISIIFINESFYAISKGITFFAITLGPVALVSVLSGTQVLYGYFLGIALTLLLPKTFEENLNRHDLFIKAIYSVLLVGGIALIAIGSA
jgi:drug/metabolite transporter (DMT)-like permease